MLKERDNLQKFIATKIKERRVKSGLTQIELAEAVSCSHQLIQKQESGEARVQADMLFRLAKVFGASPNYFFEGYDEAHTKRLNTLPRKGDHIQKTNKKQWDILLVDDSPEDELIFRHTIQSLDSKNSFSIKTCYDGVEALLHLKGCNNNNGESLPDIIFVDLNIPKKDGLTLIKNIKSDRNFHFIPVIVLTHSANAERMLQCYRNQASSYICKSSDLQDYKSKIESAIYYWTSAVVTPKNY